MLTETQTDISTLIDTFHDALEDQARATSGLKRMRRLAIFESIIKHMPDCLELDIQTEEPNTVGSHACLREFFNRRAFVKEIANHTKWGPRLREMGIDEAGMELAMRSGGMPIDRYDLTPDHVFPLNMGGYNQGNLCAVPHYLNLLRNRFHHTQKAAIPHATEFVTIIPKRENGLIPIVPIIPGGFRPYSNDDAVLFKRTNDLFGALVL